MYPSGPQTFISKLQPVRSALGRNTQTIQQVPRNTKETSGLKQASFGGTINLLNLPSVTQGIKRLPVYTPGSNYTMIFRGKRS